MTAPAAAEAKTRVIGVGQRFAGDDGVGPDVIARLEQSPPPGAELRVTREPSELVELLQHPGAVVVVDAVLDPGRAGHVRVLELDELDAALLSSLSSHGLSVAQAIQICRALYPEAVTKHLTVLAVGVDAVARYRPGLSPDVARGAAEAERWIRRRVPV